MAKRLNQFICIVTFLVYLTVFISPEKISWIGFVTISIPLFLLINFFYVFYWIKKFNFRFSYSLITLLIGYPFLQSTFNHSNKSYVGFDSIKVLSYNARVFNVYKHLNHDNEESKQVIKWVLGNDSDIKCIQEYYNSDNDSTFNITAQASEIYGENIFVKPKSTNRIGAEFGLAILTKYPIVNKGEIHIGSKTMNAAIYADIKIGMKVIRVINCHLESMSFEEVSISDDEKKERLNSNLSKWKEGMVKRSKQVDKLIEFIEKSELPVLFCGDLNEPPYTYVYQKLNSVLENSFEEAGSGFGFTFNGKIPFLRIDNQFFSDELDILNLETRTDIEYTDHYPLIGQYKLKGL